MRTTATIITSLVLLAGLTACSSGSDNSEASNCEPAALSGSSSEAITATGELDTPPEVKFPTPLHPTDTERTVLTQGEGIPAEMGQKIILELNVYNGVTGAEIELSTYDEQSPATFVLAEGGLEGLTKTLVCAQAGTRVVSAVPAADAFGPTGGNPEIGIGADDSLVFVIDVNRVFPARADGAPQAAQTGFPTVVLAPDGQPGITIPPADAPTELKVADLKTGEAPRLLKVTPSPCSTPACSGTPVRSSTPVGRRASRQRLQLTRSFPDSVTR